MFPKYIGFSKDEKEIYFIYSNNAFDETKLIQILDVETLEEFDYQKHCENNNFVVPRKNTISPWASKATDIVHNCGLVDIDKVERGYFVDSSYHFDKMTQEFLSKDYFIEDEHNSQVIYVEDIQQFNKVNDLAISYDEIKYLNDYYSSVNRLPTDVEIMMFAQINSEHCRHKIFNAKWSIDNKEQDKTLFQKIRSTYNNNDSSHILSAYKDNAAVFLPSSNAKSKKFEAVKEKNFKYEYVDAQNNIVAKVETHNHPTAIAPDSGAATGVGGEIRDEAAVGIGSRSKAGLVGFNVSNISFEKDYYEKDFPQNIATPLDIMLEAPIGGYNYENEFGRVTIAGYFRTLELKTLNKHWGFHKPIMIAGGIGNVKTEFVDKKQISDGDLLIVLGGPSMLIGVNGGAASSSNTSDENQELDFASVQRANAEMQRRAQEVINTCVSLGENNPIVSLHDVGAGGLSNAMTELVNDADLGAIFVLEDIPVAQDKMSPLEIWCNESQERFVLAISKASLEEFKEMCERERAPYAVIGHATNEKNIVLISKEEKVIDVPNSLLFNKSLIKTREVSSTDIVKQSILENDLSKINLKEAVKKVISHPCVGNKKFLITIVDKTVGGLTVQDQFVGPWQVPVSNVGITRSTYGDVTGEAMSIGEKPNLAIVDSSVASRMAIAEAITNIVSADVNDLSKIIFSANWQAAPNSSDDQNLALFNAVSAVEEMCLDLGIVIPVGKDSLSMKTNWVSEGSENSVVSPVSLVISAFAGVDNVEQKVSPYISDQDCVLIHINLSGENRLGGSIFSQVYSDIFEYSSFELPDVSSKNIKNFFEIIKKLKSENKINAYHDISDGGLFTTIAEMAIASRKGVLFKDDLNIEELFSEEIGCVIAVKKEEAIEIVNFINENLFENASKIIADISVDEQIVLGDYSWSRIELEQSWTDFSYQMEMLRDNPKTVQEEFDLIANTKNLGLVEKYNFAYIPSEISKKVAILREQGVNGHVEMAGAFQMNGNETYDVHMSDLLSKKVDLKDFDLLVACGGFSYGDVLGAGKGWAQTILNNNYLRDMFESFFQNENTLSLGVCNGCQMMSEIKELIPGASNWGKLVKNESNKFESRNVLVKIMPTNSILLAGMEDSILSVPVAHGEGKFTFDIFTGNVPTNVSMTYVDSSFDTTYKYPFNPNGSAFGVAGQTSQDGRATIMMPHPERLAANFANSPWRKMFL